MVFRIGLLPAALLPSLAGLFILDRLNNKPPFSDGVPKLLKACHDYNYLPGPARDIACILNGFFLDVVKDPLAVSLLFLVLQLWSPASIYLFEQGGKKGRPALFSPIVPIIISQIGQVLGIGPFSALVLPALYAVIKALEKPHEGLLPPASQTYTLTNFGLHQVVLGLVLGLVGLTADELQPQWQVIFWLFQFFPLLFLPLLLFSPKQPKKGDVPSATNIFDFLGFVLIPAWWANLGYAIYLYQQQKGASSIAAIFLFRDAVGVLVTHFGLYAVETVAGDSKGLPSFIVDCIWAGPPAAATRAFATKERQMAKRALALKKTK